MPARSAYPQADRERVRAAFQRGSGYDPRPAVYYSHVDAATHALNRDPDRRLAGETDTALSRRLARTRLTRVASARTGATSRPRNPEDCSALN